MTLQVFCQYLKCNIYIILIKLNISWFKTANQLAVSEQSPWTNPAIGQSGTQIWLIQVVNLSDSLTTQPQCLQAMNTWWLPVHRPCCGWWKTDLFFQLVGLWSRQRWSYSDWTSDLCGLREHCSPRWTWL